MYLWVRVHTLLYVVPPQPINLNLFKCTNCYTTNAKVILLCFTFVCLRFTAAAPRQYNSAETLCPSPTLLYLKCNTNCYIRRLQFKLPFAMDLCVWMCVCVRVYVVITNCFQLLYYVLNIYQLLFSLRLGRRYANCYTSQFIDLFLLYFRFL